MLRDSLFDGSLLIQLYERIKFTISLAFSESTFSNLNFIIGLHITSIAYIHSSVHLDMLIQYILEMTCTSPF